MIYSNDTIQQINLFEKVTRCKVKDMHIHNEILIFIVDDGAKAIGKSGKNVKRLSNLMKKKIKIVEFTDNKVSFINSLIYPLNVEIEDKGKILEVKGDTKTKALLIGRDGKNLKFYNTLLKKYFNIEMKVV
ncbi:NusA-like transcription termination signal-binding factor [Candidatus Woesearchaeota archaeon]|nr:NusA-like transcription termination signal-binding factor [Candidatus Woesearchaeota archaeon]